MSFEDESSKHEHRMLKMKLHFRSVKAITMLLTDKYFYECQSTVLHCIKRQCTLASIPTVVRAATQRESKHHKIQVAYIHVHVVVVTLAGAYS